MSLKQSGKMEYKNLSNELKELNTSIEELENKENMIKKLYFENMNNTSDYFNKKISKIQDGKNKELSKLKEQEEKEVNKISIEKEPLTDRRVEISNMFKLYSIKENLNEEIEVKYNGWCREEIELLKSENLELLKFGAFIGKNKNKPINKYDLRIEIYFKNPKVASFLNMSSWANEILEKSFKTKEEVKNYLNKNYDKIVLDYKNKHNELFEKIEKININLDEEFNFNVIKAYSHQWELKATEKNEAIFINTYDKNKKFKVEFLGDNKFKLSNKEEKRECELSLEYSIYSLTPEIIIE